MNMLDINYVDPFQDQKYHGFFGRFRRSRKFYKTYLRRPFWICMALFIIVLAISTVVSFAAKEKVLEAMGIVTDIFDQSGIYNEDHSISVFMLFLNNLRAACMSFILGFIPFLYLPTVSVLANSLIVGVMVGFIGISTGYDLLYSFLYTMLGVLPHGIFEIPALMLSCAMGYAVCTQLNKQIFRKKTKWTFDTMMGETGWYVVVRIIPLLVIAACIETWVTPLILANVKYF